MKLLVLHLSDMHIKTHTDRILSRGNRIARTLFKELHSTDAVLIIVSGDIAWSGLSDQYNTALQFFRSIHEDLKAEHDIPVYFVFSPGNHDCDFTLGGPAVRQAVINSIVTTNFSALTNDLIDSCTAVQEPFFEFIENFDSIEQVENNSDKLFKRYNINFGDYRIYVDCLNVSWLSTKADEPGQLAYPVNKYSSIDFQSANLRIAVMHHPLNWYNQQTYHHFKHFLRSNYDFIFSGHEHMPDMGQNDDLLTGRSVYVEGGILQSHEGKHADNSSFNVIVIDTNNNTFNGEIFNWKKNMYAPDNGDAAWATLRSLPNKYASPFAITDEFLTLLDDPGATFRHPNKGKLRLHDFFVYPDIKPLEEDNSRQKASKSSSSLRNIENLRDGVLLRGEERFGKTSVLFQLYIDHHDAGLIPLYINAEDLNAAAESEIKKTIERNVRLQYGEDAVPLFWQEPNDRKLLLLDDIDQVSLPPRLKTVGLTRLIEYFGNIIATSDDLFEVSELGSPDQATFIHSFKQYELLPFGHKLRYQLVGIWNSFGQTPGSSKSSIQKDIVKAETILNTVIGKNYVPSAPIYLLTLLQSIDSSQSGDLANSAFGHYYHYLIVQSLNDASIKPDKLDEIFNYCSQLAWYIKKNERSELSYQDLTLFNSEFSTQYLSTDLEARLNELLTAKVFSKRNGHYYFTYPYHYYYFVGRYLANNLQQPEVRELIRRHCSHLYVRDYANTILFLTHHTKDALVYETIMNVLGSMFSELDPLRLEKDTEIINQLINDAPKLVYHESDPDDNAIIVRTERDKQERSNTQSLESLKERSDPLDVQAQLHLTFKTAEILGQILKNHYASILNTDKENMTVEIFDGSLRAMHRLFNELVERRDIMARSIEALIAAANGDLKDEKIEDKARKSVFVFISLLMLAMISRTASSVNSENLREVIKKVVSRSDSTAYRILEIATNLEFPESIPFDEIKRVKEDNEGNIFVKRLLQSLVLMHLYMFKTTDKDKQKLCSILDIDIAFQRTIDLRSRDAKLIK